MYRFPVAGGDKEIDEFDGNFIPLCALELKDEKTLEISKAQHSDPFSKEIIESLQDERHFERKQISSKKNKF